MRDDPVAAGSEGNEPRLEETLSICCIDPITS